MTKARDIANAGTALATVDPTELGYLDGVTSAVQTQLDAKTAKATLTTTGDIYYASAANTPARLGIGSSAQVLTVASGVPSWATPGGASYTWTSYTPTITSQGGSITTYTATGKYLQIDKGMFFIFTVTLSNVGTASGNMIITLPTTAVGSSAGSVYEYNTTGKGGPVSIANNASVAISRDYNNTTWFSNGWNLYASIFYEVA
jgi:hypothetical protein